MVNITKDSIIESLKGCDLKKISFLKAKSVLEFIMHNDEGKQIYCGGTIVKGRTIARVRIHENGEEFFHTEKDLSYPPYNDIINKFSRGSLPYYSMFYGALDFDKHNDLKRKESIDAKKLLLGTAMFESQVGNKVINRGESIRFSIGYWEVKEPLDTVIVAFAESAKVFETHLREERENSLKSIEAATDPEKAYANRFLKFISEEFAKPVVNHQEYMFSALYSHKLLVEQGGWNKDAIIYPSVKTETEGLCIAIRPDVIEQKCAFASVEVCEAVQIGTNKVSVRPIYVGNVRDNDFLKTDITYSSIVG
jgi:hypothetical protein